MMAAASTRGRWIWAGVAVVVLAMIVMSRDGGAVEVESGVVTEGALTVTIDEAATTRVRHRIDVTAPASGRFVPAGVQVGDAVRAGTSLGTLHAAPLDPMSAAQARERVNGAEAALSSARASVGAADVVATNARREAQRARTLFAAGALSQRSLDDATAALAAAESDVAMTRGRVQQAEAELAAARAAVAAGTNTSAGSVVVTAPRAGRILRRFEESPRVVLAGTPLVQIGNVMDLEAVIPVLSSDAARIRPGTEVRYVVGGRADTLAGTVRLIEPAAFTKYSALGVEEQRVNVIATVSDSTGRLGDQYRLEARISAWHADAVVRVPVSALIRDRNDWAVFVVREGRAVRVQVRLGERSADAAEVREGLAPGDQVILYPGEEIADGTRVVTRGAR